MINQNELMASRGDGKMVNGGRVLEDDGKERDLDQRVCFVGSHTKP